MRRVQWLFFDLGSTLIDETEAVAHRVHDTIEGTNVSVAQFKAKMRQFAADGSSGYAEAVSYFHLSKASWHSEDERPYHDCISTLRELKARGYSLGVIANQLPGTEARLSAWGLLPFFPVIAASAECGFAKPEPELFRWALARAACLPEDAAMIGDRLDNDIARMDDRIVGNCSQALRVGLDHSNRTGKAERSAAGADRSAQRLRSKQTGKLSIQILRDGRSHLHIAFIAGSQAAAELGIVLREGVYMYFPGPQYETPAEIRMARVLGGDAVGMSTAPEVIVAAHCGMQVLGFTLLSNMAAGILDQPLSEQEVLDAAAAARERFSALVLNCLKKM